MDTFPALVWVTEHLALNLALVTRITVEKGDVLLLDVSGTGTRLEGEEAQRFLAWINRRAASSRHG
jgi:hypothetical protein